ncbi:glycosyltransferase family 2 protein [Roseomonas hellenica]|uniref:Glycosyltransferase family 2 protein n=1 Tax=Plastoroseomonas hellenica TaxID=2687306 RepID=A0ABS5EUI8_9PROT|nr:glycosyltransferase family A protein [Plastoroseomonas hellenica]MBR0663965.1 glycosyltransferase family 2 protein [Plastoroseomonas hellenica]
MSLVTVIIPVFNGASSIHLPIASVAAQTWRDIEVIVVDDGSTDDTATVTASLLAALPFPTRLIRHAANRKLSATRNTGLEAARGAWIQFLDCDDYIAPTKIAAQMAVAEQAPAQVAAVYSPFQRFHMDGARFVQDDAVSFPDIEAAHPLAFVARETFVHMSATLTRRAVLQEVGGFRQSAVPWEDDEIKIRMALAGYTFRKAPTPEAGFFWQLYPGQTRWGGPEARYRIVDVAFNFLACVRLALGGVSPAAAGLPDPVRRALDRELTFYLRALYGFSRAEGARFTAALMDYYPGFLPAYPARLRSLPKLLGVRRFEDMVARLRTLRRRVRLA